MSHQSTESQIRHKLEETFAAVDVWFDAPSEVREFKPKSSWSIDEVLEHLSLTNHFLMLTLTKNLKTAERRYARGKRTEAIETDLDALEIIGQRGSFPWERPEHMEPKGESSSQAVRARLNDQRDECLELLKRMRGGIGALASVSMSVNQLGKINLYQWLYFLVQHAARHLDQMEKLAEFYRQS